MTEPERLQEVRSETERFLNRLDILIAVKNGTPDNDWRYGHPLESGAAKRASMDLTRRLAVYRRGK